MRIPEAEWEWQGHAGHFICAARCLFTMATVVGDYLISTVGDYYENKDDEKPTTIGAGDNAFFETYVFKVDGKMKCGCAKVADWREIDGVRYATAREAQVGHLEMCRKYAEKGRD